MYGLPAAIATIFGQETALVVERQDRNEIISAGYGMLDAPRFHQGRIYFSDINEGAVLVADEAGKVERFAQFPAEVTGTGFMPNGDLLAVQMARRKLLSFSKDSRLVEHADLSALAATWDENTAPVKDAGLQAMHRGTARTITRTAHRLAGTISGEGRAPDQSGA